MHALEVPWRLLEAVICSVTPVAAKRRRKNKTGAAIAVAAVSPSGPNGSRKRPDGELPGAPAVRIGRDGVPPLATGK